MLESECLGGVVDFLNSSLGMGCRNMGEPYEVFWISPFNFGKFCIQFPRESGRISLAEVIAPKVANHHDGFQVDALGREAFSMPSERISKVHRREAYWVIPGVVR